MNFKGISVYMIMVDVVILKNKANLSESCINNRLLMHVLALNSCDHANDI